MEAPRIPKTAENTHEDLVSYAVKCKRASKKIFISLVVMVTCLCLIACDIVPIRLFNPLDSSPDTPDNTDNEEDIPPYVAEDNPEVNSDTQYSKLNGVDGYTTYCIDGWWVVLPPPRNKLNYFGNYFPVFNIVIEPADLKSSEIVYQRFSISVSYNGNVLKQKDEHIHISWYTFKGASSQARGYNILGWFTEPTDIYVTLTDKETNEVVDERIVSVKYNAEQEKYDLQITKIDN